MPAMPAGVAAVLFDLLMAVMNSLEVWSAAAGGAGRGLAWRDAVTRRMVAAKAYIPYEALIAEAAQELGLPPTAAAELLERWRGMRPWPDTASIAGLTRPYAFVTNCSIALADQAARRSGLRPHFTLSAEEAGRYKPAAETYLEACRRLGSPPERTLFVAGAPYDADGARRAGLQARLVVRRQDQAIVDPSIPTATSLQPIVAALE